MNVYTSSFPVGGFTCDLTMRFDGKVYSGLAAEWSPTVPTRDNLTKPELEEYRRGRDALVVLACNDMGVNAIILE